MKLIAPQPLRRILLFLPLIILAGSLMIATMLGYFRVVETINKDVEEHQLILARAVASQINSYLETSIQMIASIGSRAMDGTFPPHLHRSLLSAQVNTADAFSAVYLVDYSGRIQDVGLDAENSFRSQDIVQTSLANNPIFRGVQPSDPPHWSETFLSLVTGGISAAHLTPVSHGVVIVEADLAVLTGFLQRISPADETMIMVADHKGQVIADQNGRYTAVQMNISNLPSVGEAIAKNRPVSGVFDFEGERMIGTSMPIPEKGWFVLVARKVATAYGTQFASARLIIFGFAIALLFSMVVLYNLANQLSRRFEELTSHASGIAAGKRKETWPTTLVTEFNQLSDSLQQMAGSLDLQNEELRRNERRLSLAISATADAVWEWNIVTGESYYSPRWFEMLGYDNDQFPKTQETWMSLVHPNDLAHAREQLASAISREGHQMYEAEFRMRQKDGTWRWILGRGNVVEYDDAGRPILMSGTNTDISDRKRLEEQLHHAQKMESIGRLAGGVAHDFNNMLSVILGAVQLSLLKITAGSEVHQHIEAIRKAAERSRDITRQLLAFSRKEAISPVFVNLNTLIHDSLGNLARLIGEDIKLVFKPDNSLYTIKIDPYQIDQILMNLAVNARDAMPEGGTISVETANIVINDDYSRYHVNTKPGNYAQLIVSDTGCGMDRESLAHIFEPFFTTKGVGKGTGLGLATVYGIVTQNAGFINCYSEPGHGTIFKIYFPGQVDRKDQASEYLNAPGMQGSGTILLVEDEEMLLTIATKMLEESGYTVIQADNPAKAIAICQKGEEIDLILTDVVMPDMNGREMVERIKSFRPNIKVIFMSAYTSNIVAQRGIVEQGAQFIQKPFDIQHLKHKISIVLAKETRNT